MRPPEAPRKPGREEKAPMPSLMEKLVLEPLMDGKFTVREAVDEDHGEELSSAMRGMEDLVVEVLGDKEMTLMEIRGRITLPLGDEEETENLVRIAGAVWNLRLSGKIQRDEKTQKYRIINHG